MKHFDNVRTTLATLLLTTPALLFGQTTFYAVQSPNNDEGILSVVDVLTGTETNAMQLTLNGAQVDGCTGMALDPTSGMVYVVTKSGSAFTLGVLHLAFGIVFPSAWLTDKFAAIAFDDAGTLYGMTGDGANTPETLYEIDPSTGALTLVASPGTGSDGEALAFNSDNGLLYRYGGGNIFQSIDPGTGTVTDIFLSGGNVAPEAHALAYNGGSFILTASDMAYQVSLGGTLVSLSTLSNQYGYKGLVSTMQVGIASIASVEPPTVHPNPVSDRATVSVPVGGMDRLRVYDITGVLVQDLGPEGAMQYTLDVEGLTEGLYTIEVLSGNTSRTTRLSVVR